ncbi:MAG: hypothetical protein O3A35_01865 [Bacteroidetes bacterium]|nr:hypothetical protein [Bacteroidota bacterium]
MRCLISLVSVAQCPMISDFPEGTREDLGGDNNVAVGDLLL